MRVRFVLAQIGNGLRRNLAMAVSVVLVTFISLAFVGAAALLQMQVDKAKDDWYDRVEVNVYLCPAGEASQSCPDGEVTEEQIEELRGLLESDALADYVQTVYLETKEQAWEAFQERFGDQEWAQRITQDQMQFSFRVKLVDPEQYQLIYDELSGRPGVQQVIDQRSILEPLFLVLNRATLISVGLAVLMTVTAVLLITTTIRLSAMSRRRETEIMRLVGASNFFIQLPFMLEGAIAALLGAALAVGGLWVGVHYIVEEWLAESVRFMPFVDTSDVWTVAPILVAIGIGLAVVSSLVTLSRYTKV
ncbi:MAG TPA: permease-like cell division protein FtsX [Actinotalea caeni]|uniref:permease-like cell division protein FtsX n=1 Tax=Actinotalea caeni TaxID=1348467 RepID=UPI0012E245DC|nr:permease-like cell division protein FtsX [Actinotalea caeni]HLV54730.1 permease-like cell division protein FtsX [Actinotalea caeni]